MKNVGDVSYSTAAWTRFTGRWGKFEKIEESIGASIPLVGWIGYTFKEAGAGPNTPAFVQ